MNTYIRTICSYFIGLSLLLCATPPLSALDTQMPPGMPQLSPQEQKQLETEMAAFQEEFNKLSPQEQETFYQSMEEAVQKIEDLSQTEEGKELLDKLDKGDISDEELDKLINQLVGEEEKEDETQEPEVPVEETKPTPKPPVILSSKEEQAVDMISSLILRTDSFLVKVATIPEFPGNIKQWTKKGLISWTGTTQSWADLKQNIEKLVTQLSALLEHDQKTGAYYHIDELLKNETLYNNIRKVHTVVSQYEPQAEEASPLRKISKVSKAAMQKLLNQYIEALYLLKLPEEITTLIKKFDPKAQAAREAEEKATKTAEFASKQQPIAPGRPIIAGTPDEPAGYMPREQYPERRTARPAPKIFIPEEPSRAYTPLSEAPFGAPSGKRATPSTTTDKAKKEEEKDESGIPEKYKERVAAHEKKRQAEIDRTTDNIADMIDSVGKELEAPALHAMEKHLTDETPVDIELVTEIIPGVQRDLSRRRGITGKLGELRSTIKTPRGRKSTQTKLKKQYDKHKKTFEAVEKQITAVEQKFDALKESIPTEKLYAYLGMKAELPEEKEPSLPYNGVEKKLEEIAKEAKSEEEGIEKAIEYLEGSLTESAEKVAAEKEEAIAPVREIERKIPSPVSLFELRDSLRELKKSIDEFDKAPAKKAPSKK